jgi:hypothetical protein
MPTRPALLADFAARNIWWCDESPPSEHRIIAQGMSIGTYDDIRPLEAAYSASELRERCCARSPAGSASGRGSSGADPARSRRGFDPWTRRREGPFMTRRFDP